MYVLCPYTLNYLDVYFNNTNLSVDGSYERLGGTRCLHIQGSLMVLNSLTLLLKSVMLFCFCFHSCVLFQSKKGKVLPLQARLWPRGWVEA